MSRRDVEYDIVLYGATSFVGEVICRYLVDRLGVDGQGAAGEHGDIRWAIAGRNPARR